MKRNLIITLTWYPCKGDFYGFDSIRAVDLLVNNEQWILTAAHCVWESFLTRWLPLEAIAGIHDVNKFEYTAQIRAIRRRIIHPEYYGGIGLHDIAILSTVRPFKFTRSIQPIKLPYNLNITQRTFTLFGWGVLSTQIFLPDLPNKLQEVKVSYLPYDECYEAIDGLKDEDEDNPLDEDVNICTSSITGDIAACSGDSGGPLVLHAHKSNAMKDTDEVINKDDIEEDPEDNNITAVILGIVSWGLSPCGEMGAPTVYTRVSRYLEFIHQYVKI